MEFSYFYLLQYSLARMCIFNPQPVPLTVSLCSERCFLEFSELSRHCCYRLFVNIGGRLWGKFSARSQKSHHQKVFVNFGQQSKHRNFRARSPTCLYIHSCCRENTVQCFFSSHFYLLKSPQEEWESALSFYFWNTAIRLIKYLRLYLQVVLPDGVFRD